MADLIVVHINCYHAFSLVDFFVSHTLVIRVKGESHVSEYLSVQTVPYQSKQIFTLYAAVQSL